MTERSSFKDHWVDPDQTKPDEIGRLISQYEWEQGQSNRLHTGNRAARPSEPLVLHPDVVHPKESKHHAVHKPADDGKLLTEPGAFPRASGNPEAATAVIVDKKDHVTHIFQLNAHSGGIEEVMRTRDATGAMLKWTPEGRYSIIERRSHPAWTDPETMITHPAGPHNPLGPRAVRLANAKGQSTNLEMHGTNNPQVIGTNASHGCIRHKNEDILKMFPYLHVGTPVYITSHYDPVNLLKQNDFLRQ
ncbi:MAG TPA: L,D-transpeptidase [Candidatus Obscuribacterales bacterium]